MNQFVPKWLTKVTRLSPPTHPRTQKRTSGSPKWLQEDINLAQSQQMSLTTDLARTVSNPSKKISDL